MTGTQSAFELIEAAPAELASQEQQSRETRYLFSRAMSQACLRRAEWKCKASAYRAASSGAAR